MPNGYGRLEGGRGDFLLLPSLYTLRRGREKDREKEGRGTRRQAVGTWDTAGLDGTAAAVGWGLHLFYGRMNNSLCVQLRTTLLCTVVCVLRTVVRSYVNPNLLSVSVVIRSRSHNGHYVTAYYAHT